MYPSSPTLWFAAAAGDIGTCQVVVVDLVKVEHVNTAKRLVRALKLCQEVGREGKQWDEGNVESAQHLNNVQIAVSRLQTRDGVGQAH